MKNNPRLRRDLSFLLPVVLVLLTAAPPARAQEGPMIPKDSVRVYTENTFTTVKGVKDKDIWGCQFPVWEAEWRNAPEVKHILSQNPGEYEVKVLVNGRLARSLKFPSRPTGPSWTTASPPTTSWAVTASSCPSA